MITVTEPPVYVKYSIFIIAGLIAALAAGGIVYFLKFKQS
jgi:LPXTG-motif cell wall-anchored protein